jgi:RNA polymerase sigma-32 factor
MVREPLGFDKGLGHYLAEIARYPMLSRADEVELARRRLAGDTEAERLLVCANLRYVIKIAASYKGYGLRLADLIEEGNVGLLEAVRRFDPERGRRFMTYGAYWVRAMILAYVLRHHSLVGVGTGPTQSKLFFRLQRERARLAATLGVSDAEAEEALAATFHTTTDKVRAMERRLDARDQSLDALAFDDGHVSELDLLADETDDQESRCASSELDARVRERVRVAIASLDRREREILQRRLYSDEPETLATIGRELGVTRERARQLEVRVKHKLRVALAELA